MALALELGSSLDAVQAESIEFTYSDALKELTDQQFRWLTEGLCIEQQRAIPKVYPGTYSGF